MQKQRTLKSCVETAGIGLHSGKKVKIMLHPAAENTGFVFRRIDLDPIVEIKVTPQIVGQSILCTRLEQGDVAISTIEHLFSALAGLGIDNLIIDIDAEEVPIMDGSASPFIFLIQSAGIQLQDAPKKYIKIKRPVKVEKGDAYASFEPADSFIVNFEIDFNHPTIKSSGQKLKINLSKQSYVTEIGRARTFGFIRDFEILRSNNLILGGNLGNAVVLDEFRMLNSSLRYDDEFVKHKILDAIGDLYTLGYSIIGQYNGYKSGHAINNMLLLELLKHEDAWELVTSSEEYQPPIAFEPFVNGF